MLYPKPKASAAKSSPAFQCLGFLFILALLFGMIACSSLTPGVLPGSQGSSGPVKVEITPETATLTSGTTLQLSATVTNTSNTAVAWSSSAGSINSNGLFTAPSVTATQNVTVTARSLTVLGAQASVTFTITPPAAPLVITTSSLPNGTVGTSYSSTLAGSGGTLPYTWSLASGALPAGFQISHAGLLSGTASQSGTYAFAVKVTDANANTASQSLQLSISSQAGQSCGPPTYPCSRTDLQLIKATAPPQLGSNPQYYGGHRGAGVVAVDPSYNNRILRVTDGNTNKRLPGLSFMTGSSAEKNVTSYDESMFIVHGANGAVCLYHFDASTFSAQFHGCVGSLGTSGDFGYTAADQYAFYSYYLRKLYRFVIDPSTFSISTDPTFNNGIGYFDPDSPNCLNGQIAANNWYTGDSALSSDDNTMIVAVGPAQDADPYYVVWNRTKGCEWMNVQTYEVSRGWNTGMSNPQKIAFASGNTPTQVGGIHNAQIDRSGNFGVLTVNGVASLGHKIFWTIGTNQVDDTCTTCNSHWACDFGICFWNMGPGSGYDLVQQEIGTLDPILDVNTSEDQGQWGNDEHMSHANAVQGKAMVYLVDWEPGFGASSVSQVWEDEVIGVNWDGSKRTIRFNKNWDSGYGGFNGSTRCSISRQGNYALCNSDLQMYNLDKGFGNGFNEDTCDHTQQAGLINSTGCRTDVLLLELR